MVCIYSFFTLEAHAVVKYGMSLAQHIECPQQRKKIQEDMKNYWNYREKLSVHENSVLKNERMKDLGEVRPWGGKIHEGDLCSE